MDAAALTNRWAVAALVLIASLLLTACGTFQSETKASSKATKPSRPVAELTVFDNRISPDNRPDNAILLGEKTILNCSWSRYLSKTHSTFICHWQILSQPKGSYAYLDNPTADKPNLVADKEGDYTVHLVVQTGTGLKSKPAVKTFTATRDGARSSAAGRTSTTNDETHSTTTDNRSTASTVGRVICGVLVGAVGLVV